ncbi:MULTISPECIES: thiol peroxidase [unclassified Corynebacterium]|uniref:thiol peroxidase n=1 Tax=unclassified Corynebacterium TaxID=2624378 RepID=UPI0030AE0F6A
MAHTAFQGNPVQISGDLPAQGASLPAFEVTGTDLASLTNSDFAGKRTVLNIFPSVDTGVCAASVRRFNELAAEMDNTVVLNVSRDLPFALARFCGAEGIENVQAASDFRHGFGEQLGVVQQDGPLAGLLARSVVVADADGNVVYTQLVPEITEEPDYDAALAALK